MEYSNIVKFYGGDWNVICDVCGRKRKRSQCGLGYGTGMIPNIMSCLDGCYDYMHPLTLPPPLIPDGQPVPDARPQPESYFSNTNSTSTMWLWGNFPPSGPIWSNFNGVDNIDTGYNVQMNWGTFP